jgi:aryl-alcohol dehydrogenase-like predicted oxidoreductase
MGLVSEQSLYNLNARMIELEVIPACEAYGLGLIPWSPVAGGALAGILGPQKKSGNRRNSNWVTDRLKKPGERKKFAAWEALCRKLREEPAHVALAWLLHQKAVTAPIIGPRTMEHLTGTMRVLKIKLSPDTLNALDRIFPGPGGRAPEAYAW